MVENAGRKVALVAFLVISSLILLLVPDDPIPMGLDLAGGRRLVYRFDFDSAIEAGNLPPETDRDQVLNETIAIVRNRVDPTGVREPIIRRVGLDRIEIALPGDSGNQTSAVAELGVPIEATGQPNISLAGSEKEVIGFPGGGGVVKIDDELLRYERRSGNQLTGVRRGEEGTQPAAHAPSTPVVLVSDDSIKNAIENLGNLRFHPQAKQPDFAERGTTEASEREKVVAWLRANPEVPISVYNSLTPEQGGAPAGILWFTFRLPDGAEDAERADRPLMPLMDTPPEWTFTGADLAFVGKGSSRVGYPTVTFEMNTDARFAFGEFTGNYIDEVIAIVLNDEIASAPVIQSALIGQSAIEGRFTDKEVNELVTVLRTGSLKIQPILEQEERVGATLGDQYVARGFQGGVVALIATLLFMAFYYRRLGLFACVALACNLTMLMGVMVLLQGTLTLPGIAGIILTVGMAVDANILIFDRIREEAEKGRKTIQAAKDGFGNAMSAIIDANVTTLLTALILYNVGTGPIRGFAVTLSIGIITSVFSALVITRVLVHYQLEKGVEKFKMARWLADAKFQFMSKSKLALTASAIVVVAGTGYFIALPDSAKLGIDFLGGARVKVRTEEPQTPDRMRELVSQIPGDIGGSEVTALPAADVGGGRYTEFAITFKTDPSSDSEGGERLLEREIRANLAEILQRGPIEASIEPQTGAADLVLYFEEEHAQTDVVSALEAMGLTDVNASVRPERPDIYEVRATATPGTSADLLKSTLQTRFAAQRDSAGRSFELALPVPETSVIGSQVVGELRDSAIKALLLSIFLVVIYIRVRFAEYSYGLAAVAAVVHDVLVTLAAIALMITLGLVEVEMSLTMIAAFLTILGYSLNDTIVIFDRVRENLPRMKGTLSEIVNVSINQTLSRTIVTSATTLMTVLVVFFFNFGTRNALEGFTFALAVGVIAGTYSTIFVACPLLVWFEGRAKKKRDAHGSSTGEGSKGDKLAEPQGAAS